jgi:hypothetical protein
MENARPKVQGVVLDVRGRITSLQKPFWRFSESFAKK